MVQMDQLFLVNKYYVGGFTEFRNLKNIISLTAVKLKIVPVKNISKPIIWLLGCLEHVHLSEINTYILAKLIYR